MDRIVGTFVFLKILKRFFFGRQKGCFFAAGGGKFLGMGERRRRRNFFPGVMGVGALRRRRKFFSGCVGEIAVGGHRRNGKLR